MRINILDQAKPELNKYAGKTIRIYGSGAG